MDNKEEIVRNLFNEISDVFIRTNMDGKCQMITPSIYEMTGYKPEELVGKDMIDFYADPNQRNVIINKILESKSVENFEIEILRKDGKKITVSSNTKIYYDSNDNPLGIEGIFRDITKQKRAESEHDKLFNLSFDLLCIAGFDGYFKELNPAWEKVTGYSRSQLKEKPFLEFIHSDDRIKTQDEINRLLKGGHTFNFENRYLTRKGSIIHLSWTVTPLPEESLMYCIARDISEHKAAEIKIRDYQQRLRDLTHELTISEERVRNDIAADLHDHVGQMLASARMQLARINVLEKDIEINKRIDNISKILLKASQTTRAVIFDLSPPQLKELGLFAAVHDWMKDQVENKHGIQATMTGDQGRIGLDEKSRILLFRSVKELLINVVKHARADQVKVNFSLDDKWFEIEVEDNGIGFEFNPDLLRIRSKRFGMFSIQERITGLRGKLLVESEIGKGSKIIMKLPLKEKIIYGS